MCFVCVYTHVHMCAHHTWRPEETLGYPLSVLYTFVEARSLGCLNLLSRLGWLARELQESPAPISAALGSQTHTARPGISDVGSRAHTEVLVLPRDLSSFSP